MLAGLFTNVVFGVFICSVLLATVDAGGGSVAGYDRETAATNVWVMQGLFAVMYMQTFSELAERVRSGDIAVDLARPVDVQFAWLATDLGRAGFVTLARLFVPVGFGALFFGARGPATPGRAVAFAVGLVLAVVVSFACRFAVSLVAFWLVEIRGIMTFFSVGSGLLAGLIVPLHLFPGWARTAAYATPFPAMLQAPADLWVGRGSVPWLLAMQLAWAVVMLAVGRLVFRRGIAKLVVQGG
jgi:ABC-2 type transport system permease protein